MQQSQNIAIQQQPQPVQQTQPVYQQQQQQQQQPSKYLNEQQERKLKEIFDLFDKDKSGAISKDELGTALRAMGQTPTESEIDEFLKEADTNKSGQIEWHEFLAVVPKKLKAIELEEQERELMEAFKLFDTDNDGIIDAKEFTDTLMRLGEKLTQAQAAQLAKDADLNGNGKIEYSEFVKWLMSH